MKTVFFDVDTQLDFLLPAGALYVPGAETIVPALARLAKFASENSHKLISTMDAHTEDDAEFVTWKPHCVSDTVGQQKPLSTLLPQSFIVPTILMDSDNLQRNASLSPQIRLEKQHIDCFTNPNLGPLLAFLNADRYVVYGVVTEICVQQAVLGLLTGRAGVYIVTDAVRSLDVTKADLFFKTVAAKGAILTTVAELCS